jgi:hypothetical protein
MTKALMKTLILLSCILLGATLFGCSAHYSDAGKIADKEMTPVDKKTTAAVEEGAPTGQGEEQPNPFYYKPPERECTRATLMEAADSYIAAQEAGDLSKMSLAPDAKFLEDMSKTTKDKGLWNTPLPIAHHRSIYDAGRCKAFTEAIVTEGGHPYVIGTRLTVDKGKVTEINSLVTDKEDWLFNAEDYLKYSKAEDWPVLPVDDRVSRQDLIDAANQYFDFVFMDKSIRPRWGAPCARLEGGMYTNTENKEDKDTCRVPAPLGEMPVPNRTFLVDEEMGAVNVFCRFGSSKDGMPDSHTFRLVDGKYRWIHTLSVNLTGEAIEVEKYTPEKDCECTRSMLQAAADSYIAAQEAGDISKMAFSDDATFKENMSEISKDKGLWNTPLPIALHRSIYDTGRCKTFSEVIVTEGENQYVIGTRLKVDNDGRIKGIDSLVTGKGDWLFNADDYLKYSKAEDWPPLSLDDQMSRQDLVNAGNQYFDYVFMDKGIRPPFGGVPCARLEGGAYTNPKNEEKDTCYIPAPLGELPIVDRTFVVDEEMGTVNVFCRFGDTENGMPDSHTFRLVNGKYKWIHTLSVNLSDTPLAVPDDAPGVPK